MIDPQRMCCVDTFVDSSDDEDYKPRVRPLKRPNFEPDVKINQFRANEQDI